MLFATLNKKRLILAIMLPFSVMAGRDGRSSYANGQRRMPVSKMAPKASAQKYTDLSDLRIGFLKPGIVTTLLLLNMFGPHLVNAMPSTETSVDKSKDASAQAEESKPVAQDKAQLNKKTLDSEIPKSRLSDQYNMDRYESARRHAAYLHYKQVQAPLCISTCVHPCIYLGSSPVYCAAHCAVQCASLQHLV